MNCFLQWIAKTLKLTFCRKWLSEKLVQYSDSHGFLSEEIILLFQQELLLTLAFS